jgi:HYR domain-containing protein
MRRSTRFSTYFSLLKSGSAAALALATILSCSDSTSPTEGLDGVIRIKVASVGVDVPDALKQAMSAEFAGNLMSASIMLASPSLPSVASLTSSSCSSGGASAGYEESRVAFNPEQIPNIAPFPLKPDGYIPDSFVPLGFNFSFHGKTYDKVNVYSNGFLLFGQAPPLPLDGFFKGGVIPAAGNPNNIIAVAWSDWSPELVPDGIRFETRGTAPNRKFILQFNNVPEYASTSKVGAIKPGVGWLMAQVVLYEGSNDIVIYTNTMNLTNSNNRLTQGIENADGTLAKYDSIQNPNTGVWSPRVAKFFSGIRLTNDAVRFSLASAKDEQIPSITAPSNVSKDNDPGLASAVVAVGSPVAADNCGDVNVTSSRSDGAAIDAPYPVGLTTITWTATDAAGNKASATQTVEVFDIEAPVFASVSGVSAQSVLRVNATSPAGAAVTFDLNVTDNVGVISQSCEPASGSVFSAGNHDVICSASDAAGNKGYNSFSVFVVNAQQQMESLMTILRRQPDGTSQPLINQLKSAYRERGNECKKMDDFMHLLSEKAETISEADMAAITSAAQDIIGALGCAEGAGTEAPDSSPHKSKAPNQNTSEPVKF